MKTKKIAIVINDSRDPRIAAFGELFGRLGDSEVVFIGTKGAEWVRLKSNGGKDVLYKEQERPTRVDILLVHGSDWDACLPILKSHLKQGVGRTFIFNASGDPPRREGAIRIIRSTEPFALSGRDAQQLILFSANPSAALPACCVPMAKTLIALDILCQGYRATHTDSTLPGIHGLSGERREALMDKSVITEKDAWWLNGLQIQSLNELRQRIQRENVANDDIIAVCSKVEDVENAIKAISQRANLQINITTEEKNALKTVGELHVLLRGILA